MISFDNPKMGKITRKNYFNVMRDVKIKDKNWTPIQRYMSVIKKSKPKHDGPLQVYRYNVRRSNNNT